MSSLTNCVAAAAAEAAALGSVQALDDVRDLKVNVIIICAINACN